jgi:hypothetical protein
VALRSVFPLRFPLALAELILMFQPIRALLMCS